MSKYLIKKLISLIIVLIGVSILSFIFSTLSPTDPAEAYAQRVITRPTKHQISEIKKDLGYDVSIFTQYVRWVQKVINGDFGMSLLTRKKVSDEIGDKFFATSLITALVMLFTILITIPLSILSAIRKGRILDKVINGLTILGISLPNFWIGFMLLIFFAVKIPIFNVVDYGNFRSLILPSLAIAIPVSAVSIRVFRSGLISGYQQEFVIYARARGLSERKIAGMVIRNALPPIITLFFQNIGYCLASSATIEAVFSWPGIGSHIVKAILSRDLPTINACVFIIATIFVLLNFLADIVNHLIDPLSDIKKEANYGL